MLGRGITLNEEQGRSPYRTWRGGWAELRMKAGPGGGAEAQMNYGCIFKASSKYRKFRSGLGLQGVFYFLGGYGAPIGLP